MKKGPNLGFKKNIQEQLLLKVKSQLKEAKQNLIIQKQYAQSDDLKSEGKYDTRATEAKYLIDAQAKRVHELEEEIKLLEELEFHSSTSEIILGSLALLEHNGVKNWHFLSTAQGGTMIQIDGLTVLVISVFSPLGSELIGLEQEEVFSLETPKGVRSYKISKIV